MIKALSDPIVEDGIPFTAYFNGRLLSGEDLARDQIANREARRRIGQAVGHGVAFGLEVFESPGGSSKTAPVLTVQPGTAIARDGHTLSLGRGVDLQLVRPATTGGGAPGTVTTFRVCDPPRPGVFVVGEGVYVLVMAAAQATEGRAPVSGLSGSASCNVRSVVEGVQFRLVQPKIGPDILSDVAHLRNRVAAAALGVIERFASYTNPIAGALSEYGLVDSLRADGSMTDADVPLALLHWTAATGITFVDMWAIRRRVTARGAEVDWSWLFGDRIRAESEAMFQEFQEHITDIAAGGEDVSKIAAVDRFFYLPPFGILPLQMGARPGFDVLRFFGADMLPKDIAYTDATLLRSLAGEALAHDPILLASPERLQLYFVFENIQTAAAGQSVTPVVIFASPRLPYRGVARFGFARWDQARYAPRVI